MAAPNFPRLEEDLQKEWEEKGIFKKTLEKPSRRLFLQAGAAAGGGAALRSTPARPGSRSLASPACKRRASRIHGPRTLQTGGFQAGVPEA